MKTAYCFDVDGTLTTTEILPCIATELGVADEIETLTRATMNGHIAFEASFRLRYLILSAISVTRIRTIVAQIPLDEAILEFIRAHQADAFLVTGNLDVWVAPIAEACGCRIFSSQSNTQGGALKLGKVLNKGDAVSEIRALGYDRVVAVGDGANDVPMLTAADVGIAFGGVHSPSTAAKEAADYIIHEGQALCKILKAL